MSSSQPDDKQQGKIERFISMLEESFDFNRLYDELGLVAS